MASQQSTDDANAAISIDNTMIRARGATILAGATPHTATTTATKSGCRAPEKDGEAYIPWLTIPQPNPVATPVRRLRRSCGTKAARGVSQGSERVVSPNELRRDSSVAAQQAAAAE